MSEWRGALRWLLGPAGADAGCDRGSEVLDQFVELELSGGVGAVAFPDVAAHLEGCPDCREDYLALRRVASEREEGTGSG